MSKDTIELYRDSGLRYRWRVRSANGNILAYSANDYASLRAARQTAMRRAARWGCRFKDYR